MVSSTFRWRCSSCWWARCCATTTLCSTVAACVAAFSARFAAAARTFSSMRSIFVRHRASRAAFSAACERRVSKSWAASVASGGMGTLWNVPDVPGRFPEAFAGAASFLRGVVPSAARGEDVGLLLPSAGLPRAAARGVVAPVLPMLGRRVGEWAFLPAARMRSRASRTLATSALRLRSMNSFFICSCSALAHMHAAYGSSAGSSLPRCSSRTRSSSGRTPSTLHAARLVGELTRRRPS
mmetsp:Transcript_46685/g.143971  ORF Transcript_46685/g.143971 Transcript_46685/m.143971 type:complete len:239 (-) Transcript_46685:23-739(-)